MRAKFLAKLSLLLLTLILCICGYMGTAQAASIVVNTTDDTIAPSDGKCSLREAIENANTNSALYNNCVAGQAFPTIDQITFALPPNATIQINGIALPLIYDSLEINATNSLVLDAGGASGILLMCGCQSSVSLPIEVLLYNLTLQNGISPSGGALNAWGKIDLTIRQSRFNHNQTFSSPNSRGGAIYVWEQVNLRLEGSSFQGNLGYEGGAISAGGDTNVNIISSSFSQNLAAYGGALDLSGLSATIEGTHFTDNRATDYGGAISSIFSSLSIANSALVHNTSDINGGAVDIDHGALTVVNSQFEQNTTDVGGAVYGRRSVLSFTASTFVNNKANFEGGAIFVAAESGTSTLVIDGGELQGNYAGRYGGAIFSSATGDSGNTGILRNTVQINQARLIRNQVNDEGGAIYIERGGLTIRSSLFEQNRVASFETLSQQTRTGEGAPVYNGGGAISARSALLRIDRSIFSQNLTAHDGGGAITFETGRANITNSRFMGNQATNGGGGAINCESGAINLSIRDLEVITSTFIENSAGTSGGAIHQQYCTGMLANSSVISNSASTNGGAFDLANGSYTLENSTLSGNRAQVNGGAIYHTSDYYLSSSTLAINYSTIVNNNATEGAGIYQASQSGGFPNASVANTILAGNLRTNTLTPNDCTNSSGTFTSLGYNLTITNPGSSCQFASNDLQILYAQLFSQVLNLALTDDGNSSTHALLFNGAAIDAGSPSSCPTTDQRGILRIDGHCDIGAYELIKIAINMRITAVGNNVKAVRTVTATVFTDDSLATPLQGVPIGFQVSGGTTLSVPTQLSNVVGQATFTYTSESPTLNASQIQDSNALNALVDHITVWADLSNNGLLDVFEPQLTVDRDTAVELLAMSALANPDGSVTLAWQTAVEIDNAGFNLYRAEQMQGPYLKINPQLIAAQSMGGSASYSFNDMPPKPGMYYYQLEDVNTVGGSKRHDPVEVNTNDVQLHNYLPMIQR